MDREEILRRSRVEKAVTGQSSSSIHALFWSYISLEAWGKYRLSRRRAFAAIAALAAVSSLCFLFCHVLEVLR